MNAKPEMLQIEPLSQEAFEPYGDVIDTDGRDWFHINQGSTQRFHDLAKIDVADEGGYPIVSIFRAQPLSFPLTVTMMERHPLCSQAFIPMENRPFLVIVAPPGEFEVSALRCFITGAQQGVNYRKNAWHHPVIALGEVSNFVVIDRCGEGHNCDEQMIPKSDQPVVQLNT